MTTNVNNSRNTASRIEKDLAASYEISYYSNPKQVLSAAENALINRNGISENDHVGWEAKRLQV